MQLDRFTIKSQEALQAAIRVAADRRNTETAPAHLLLALLDQQEGIVSPVLRKVGADPAAIRSQIVPLSPSAMSRSFESVSYEATTCCASVSV